MTVDKLLASLPDTLEYTGEFGSEVIGFLPFVYWLHKTAGLGERRLRTYHGMRPFYWFVDPVRYEEKTARRRSVLFSRRPQYLPNPNEMTATRSPYEIFPDFREVYGGDLPFATEKPLLFIHNKYCVEWSHGPVNFIPLEVLEQLFGSLKHRYQIIYSREGFAADRLDLSGFSEDRNAPLRFDDEACLERHPEVISFERLVASEATRYSYNELKLRIFAKCRNFISSQGGGAHLCALFSGSILIVLHRTGYELRGAYAHGFYRHAAQPPPTLLITRTSAQLLDAAQVFDRAFEIGGQATVHPSAAALLNRYAAEQSYEPNYRHRLPTEW